MRRVIDFAWYIFYPFFLLQTIIFEIIDELRLTVVYIEFKKENNEIVNVAIKIKPRMVDGEPAYEEFGRRNVWQWLNADIEEIIVAYREAENQKIELLPDFSMIDPHQILRRKPSNDNVWIYD